MNFLNILSIEFFFFLKKKTSKNWKNWTLLGYHSKDWIFLLNIWLKELNFFSKFDSKNCSFFFFMIQILGPFSHQRIEPSILRDSNTWTFLKIFDSKKWTLFFRTQSFFINKKKTHRIEFLNPTHRIDIFFELNRLISWIWRKEFSWVWRKDLNPFFKISLKEVNFLMNMTQRTKVFLKVWLKELNSFLKRWLNEFNSVWKYASKNLTLFLIRLKELNFFMNMTQRFFFGKKLWLKESKLFLWI